MGFFLFWVSTWSRSGRKFYANFHSFKSVRKENFSNDVNMMAVGANESDSDFFVSWSSYVWCSGTIFVKASHPWTLKKHKFIIEFKVDKSMWLWKSGTESWEEIECLISSVNYKIKSRFLTPSYHSWLRCWRHTFRYSPFCSLKFHFEGKNYVSCCLPSIFQHEKAFLNVWWKETTTSP